MTTVPVFRLMSRSPTMDRWIYRLIYLAVFISLMLIALGISNLDTSISHEIGIYVVNAVGVPASQIKLQLLAHGIPLGT
jgi:hypothetical protein